jgi:hypothetical protein
VALLDGDGVTCTDAAVKTGRTPDTSGGAGICQMKVHSGQENKTAVRGAATDVAKEIRKMHTAVNPARKRSKLSGKSKLSWEKASMCSVFRGEARSPRHRSIFFKKKCSDMATIKSRSHISHLFKLRHLWESGSFPKMFSGRIDKKNVSLRGSSQADDRSKVDGYCFKSI